MRPARLPATYLWYAVWWSLNIRHRSVTNPSRILDIGTGTGIWAINVLSRCLLRCCPSRCTSLNQITLIAPPSCASDWCTWILLAPFSYKFFLLFFSSGLIMFLMNDRSWSFRPFSHSGPCHRLFPIYYTLSALLSNRLLGVRRNILDRTQRLSGTSTEIWPDPLSELTGCIQDWKRLFSQVLWVRVIDLELKVCHLADIGDVQ